jgi:7-cyano-7-deazaguanine synthase
MMKGGVKNRKAVVLLSGGLDSATALYSAKKQGFKCYCLIFDYDQRHRKEISCARRIAQKAGCNFKIIKIGLPWKASALLDYRIRIPAQRVKAKYNIPSTYVPARNIIFLSFGLSYAEAIGAQAVFIGAHTQDYSGYPDCRPEFFRAFGDVAACGTKSGVEKRKISIETPLIHKTKAAIVRLGRRLGVPFELTWSCYHGKANPCGTCDSCHYRAKGFKEAKLKDPLIKL